MEEKLFPQCMPIDAKEFSSKFSKVNFLNAYYQIHDALTYKPERILVIGVGVGLEPIILQQKFHLDVCTLDIDPDFEPDYVGSVHNMEMFSNQQFDVVLASHVLEHLPFSFFKTCLQEMSRVASHAVVYLPYGGRHLEWKFTWAQHYREYGIHFRLPSLRRVSGEKLDLQQNLHYWECGYPGFSIQKISSNMKMYFHIDKMYHNQDWKHSLNFLLTSRRSAQCL